MISGHRVRGLRKVKSWLLKVAEHYKNKTDNGNSGDI